MKTGNQINVEFKNNNAIVSVRRFILGITDSREASREASQEKMDQGHEDQLPVRMK